MSVRFGLHAAAIALQLGVGAAAAVLVSNVDPGQAISSDTSAWPLITAIPATAVAVIDGALWLCDNIIRENVDFFARPTEWIDDSDEGKRVCVSCGLACACADSHPHTQNAKTLDTAPHPEPVADPRVRAVTASGSA